jgi:hypothetical protein
LIYRNSCRDFKIPWVEITGLKVVSVPDTVGPLPSKMPGSTSYLLVSSTGRNHPIAICVTNFAAMLRSIKAYVEKKSFLYRAEGADHVKEADQEN